MTYPIREHADEQDDALAAQIDQRPGPWTRLQLMEMDAAFCLQMRRPTRSGKTGSAPDPFPIWRRGEADRNASPPLARRWRR